MDFKDKVAVVTGAASGIGAATTRALAGRGAKVAAGDLNEAGLKEMEQRFAQEGLTLLGVATDVADEAQVARLFEQADRHFGGVDLLVNNAGISPKHKGKKKNLWQMEVAEWDRVQAVNLRGGFLCCAQAVPRMIEGGGGAIVNVSSLAAKAGSVITGCHYVSSKAGLVGLTKVLAREVAQYGIRVNGVAPGRIDTPMIWDVPAETNEQYKEMIPLRRLGTPQEVADGILYLLSEASAYVTGVILDINGGVVMTY